MPGIPLRHGVFLPPFHPMNENPSACIERDLELMQNLLPDMPLIGFYGNGEIAPVNGVNEMLQYSAVLGLFHHV